MPKIMIDRDQLRQQVESAVQLVEVLPAKEYARAHLPGAVNIPLADLTEKTAARLDRRSAVVVYCYDYQ